MENFVMGTVNSKQSQRLLDPYIKVTIGKLGEQVGDTFTLGDGKLIKASVTLGEGKVQSSCSFTVLDADRSLVDKYFTYIEKVGGLDPVEAPSTTQNTNVSSISNSVINQPDQTTNTSGKVIFNNVQASTYDGTGATGGGSTGAYGDKIDFNGYYAAMVDTKYKYATMRVTNLANNKSVVVKVIDRGPFAVDSIGRTIYPLRENSTRKIDLTPKAFSDLAPLSQGIINVKIEWLEAATATTSTSNNGKTSQQIVEQNNRDNKATQANTNPFNKIETVGDWPLPKVGPTKTILITSGHRIDIATGTNGTSSTSVTYAGETRTVESVATEIAAQVFRTELIKAGYTVITPPQLPSARGDAARIAYQDAVKALKEQTGAYTLELHFDDDTGSAGVIPGAKYDVSGNSLSIMDVALAKSFGSYSFNHRKPLSAPSRGITILEIAPLNNLLTNLTISGVAYDNFQPLKDALYPYAKKFVTALNTVAAVSPSQQAAESTSANPVQESIPSSATLSGSQIVVEMGYGGKTIAAYSFVHVGLKFSLFEPNALEFTGQAASWLLTQRVKNTVYQNMSFKKIAQRITSSYGMKLVMPEEGPTYTYFPQRGQTDYEALLIEARRIGYRVHTKGATLYIQPRQGVTADKQIFVLEYGDNMGTSFQVTHQAQRDSSGGARSSAPGANNTTGERKYEIDPDSGQVVQKRKENVVGTGRDSAIATTGSPIALPTPKTTGATDKQDAERNANENRIKGIVATAEFPTTPEALTLDPDTPFLTKGVSAFLDRMWVVDTVSHEYQTGNFVTKVTCYSPIKNKNAANSASPSVTSISNPVIPGSANSTGFIRPTPGVVTSRHRTVNPQRPKHKGIDLGDPVGTPVRASAAGTISTISTGCQVGNFQCGGGYGNFILISHADGYQTRYAHLSEVLVTSGAVQQGQVIGRTGHTGHSTGPHLHFEILKNGLDLNPEKFINF